MLWACIRATARPPTPPRQLLKRCPQAFRTKHGSLTAISAATRRRPRRQRLLRPADHGYSRATARSRRHGVEMTLMNRNPIQKSLKAGFLRPDHADVRIARLPAQPRSKPPSKPTPRRRLKPSRPHRPTSPATSIRAIKHGPGGNEKRPGGTARRQSVSEPYRDAFAAKNVPVAGSGIA